MSKKRIRRRNKYRKLLRTLAMLGLCVSFIVITVTLVERAEEKKNFAALQAAAAQGRQDAAATEELPPEEPPAEATPTAEAPQETIPETTAPVSHARFILPEYLDLFGKNGDMFGWVRIEGTALDYPVMYTPKRPEYYLSHDFDRKKSESGIPFMDASCYEGCGNYLIHGHNMHHNGMFAPLLKYENHEFWQNHSTIYFDTMYETGVYEVMAMFRSKVYEADEDGLRYYAYTDLTDESRFNYFVEKVKIASIYETGVTAEFGDELLTLSTCSYHTDNGRFVVVAKKIR